MRYGTIIFDLEGTLWQNAEVQAYAWSRLKNKFNIVRDDISASELLAVYDQSFETQVKTIFSGHSDKILSKLMMEIPTEVFNWSLRHKGKMYPEVEKNLKRLHKFYPLYLISDQNEDILNLFLENSGYTQMFKDKISWKQSRVRKDECLYSLIAQNKIQNPVYIGDGLADFTAAKRLDIPFIHIGYNDKRIDGAETFHSFDLLTEYLVGSV